MIICNEDREYMLVLLFDVWLCAASWCVAVARLPGLIPSCMKRQNQQIISNLRKWCAGLTAHLKILITNFLIYTQTSPYEPSICHIFALALGVPVLEGCFFTLSNLHVCIPCSPSSLGIHTGMLIPHHWISYFICRSYSRETNASSEMESSSTDPYTIWISSLNMRHLEQSIAWIHAGADAGFNLNIYGIQWMSVHFAVLL